MEKLIYSIYLFCEEGEFSIKDFILYKIMYLDRKILLEKMYGLKKGGKLYLKKQMNLSPFQ